MHHAVIEYMPEIYEKIPFLKVRFIEICTTSLFNNFLY